MKSFNKEFAFVKLITCGQCGSGITADEKLKKLKDGSVNRYVYYGCTSSRDIHCKNPWIREEDLINQFIKLIDKVDLDKSGIKEKIQKEIDRYYTFRHGILGIDNESKNKKDIDIRKYAQYILKEGNNFEKRELLTNLKSKMQLNEREIRLA